MLFIDFPPDLKDHSPTGCLNRRDQDTECMQLPGLPVQVLLEKPFAQGYMAM